MQGNRAGGWWRWLIIPAGVCCAAGVASDRALAVDLIGYLPYYRMGANYNANVLPAQLPMLDEIRYFGLTAGSDGSVAALGGSGSLATHQNRIQTIKQAIDALPVADRPRLNITLGGAGEAANFATVAASSSLRDTFAQNIKAFLNLTGATSVDIDWEHPSGAAQFNNYATMLQRIKQEVGADRRVYATIDPIINLSPTVLNGANGIDGISLMTYDLSWWANDLADPNRGEHSLPAYVEDAFEAWTQPPGSSNQRPYVFGTWGRNAPTEKLGVGMPFYGRAIGTPQSPQGGTAYTWSELDAGGTATDVDGNYYSYLGQPVWIPGPNLAAERVQFAHDRGLQHIIIWEIGQDLSPSNPDSLLRRMYDKSRSFDKAGDYDGDGDVDNDDYQAWQSSYGRTGFLKADGNGNQVVDLADYIVWRSAMSAAGNGAATSQLVAVPEPTIATWIGLVAMLAIARRPQRRQRVL